MSAINGDDAEIFFNGKPFGKAKDFNLNLTDCWPKKYHCGGCGYFGLFKKVYKFPKEKGWPSSIRLCLVEADCPKCNRRRGI